MSLLHMAWRYLRARLLVTLLTVAGIGLGVALVCGVLALRRESERAFAREAALFDLIAGGKGSPLQLVLSCVYHLDSPTGNLPYADYEKLKRDPRVLWAAPIGLGDNHAGHRIIGTEAQFFAFPGPDGEPFFQLAEGRVFQDDFEVVLGHQAAVATGLNIGDSFSGTHGLVSVPGAEVHDDFPYRVCGILRPTGTSQDRAIFGTLQSVWQIHETEDRLHSAIQGRASLNRESPRETTAILIRLKTPGLRLWMADEIRNRSGGIAAVPVNEVLRLYQGVIGPAQRALLFVAGAVVAVSCLTILATLYQAGERRRRDVAIVRSLGAGRAEVAALVFCEGLLLTLAGLALGLALGHGGLAAAAASIRDHSGLIVNPWSFDAAELKALGIMAACGMTAALFPAIRSYRHTPLADLDLTI
jgi:putative ABC transport system permease protein